jgi:dTDP-glucose 4,6-dehydratase
MKIMITGGYGFIGSNLVNYWKGKYPDAEIVVLDALTYAANPKLVVVEHNFAHVDIRDHLSVHRAMETHRPDAVIHLAAESHVCRSIEGPKSFFETNVNGTFHLLEEFRALGNGGRFHHVSTDEIFGEVTNGKPFDENSAIRPRSPYSSSKAAADMVVNAYVCTYGVNAVITSCGNNFGPGQNVEKLIPRIVNLVRSGKPITIYGDGSQIRDWLYVEDNCSAIDFVFHRGRRGERYMVGDNCQLSNREMIQEVLMAMGHPNHECVFTKDRPTDDKWYASDASKLKKLGWEPKTHRLFTELLLKTVRSYQ